MRYPLILSKIFFILSVFIGLGLQTLVLLPTLRKKEWKELFTKLIFTFAVSGLIAEPATASTNREKPTTRGSAKFNYEVGFEVILFEFNITTLVQQANLVKDHTATMKAHVPKLSTQAGNMAVGSLFSDCEVKTNASLAQLDTIRSFFEGGTRVQGRSAEFLGELWHEVSGSPGPLEYHKEVEAMHRIEQTFKHTSSTMIDQQKEIKILSTTLEDEQKEIEKSGKDILSLVTHFKDSYNEQTALTTIIDFNAKCNLINFQIRMNTEKIRKSIEMGTERRASIDLVNMKSLRSHILDIKHKEKILSPIFSPAEAQLYFTLPLVTMTWSQNVIKFFLRVPLVDFSKRYEISPINKASSTKLSSYDYILTSSDGKYFRFLSDVELKNCIKTKGQFISDLRMVQSSLRMLNCNQLGCTGKNDNGPFEITQLTATTFAYSANTDQNATLLCNRNRSRVYLPREGFITIPADCSLMSNLFEIDNFPQDKSFLRLSQHLKFAVSELEADFNTSEGQWHLGFNKLKNDVHLNMAELDLVKVKVSNDFGRLKTDLADLEKINTFLQSQIYGGIGVSGAILILLLILGISLCCFLKRRFATFVRV